MAVQHLMTVLPPLYLLADLLRLDPDDPADDADLDALAALLARRLLVEADRAAGKPAVPPPAAPPRLQQ